MDSPLIQSLIRWTEKITKTQFPEPLSPGDYLLAFKYLLLDIDPEFFEALDSQPAKASQIIHLISQYNSTTLKTPLPFSALPSKPQSLTSSKISQIFQLIFAIAFKVDHSKYVVDILSLKQDDQQILMSFVDTLMKQEPQMGSQHEASQDEIKKLLEELEKKQFENRGLKQKNEDLEQSLYQHKERMIVLKDQNQRIAEELHQIQSQKTELIIELGLHQYDSSYSDIIKRYKEQIKNYQTKLQDLQNFLDSKNSQIQESSSEIQLLKQSIGSKKEMEEEKQFKKLEFNKILDMNNQEIDELKKQIDILNEQIVAKNQRIMDLSKDNRGYLEEIKEEKKKLLDTEKPLAKMEQFKKLYSRFVVQIKPYLQ